LLGVKNLNSIRSGMTMALGKCEAVSDVTIQGATAWDLCPGGDLWRHTAKDEPEAVGGGAENPVAYRDGPDKTSRKSNRASTPANVWRPVRSLRRDHQPSPTADVPSRRDRGAGLSSVFETSTECLPLTWSGDRWIRLSRRTRPYTCHFAGV
jgi:hypothetical protein